MTTFSDSSTNAAITTTQKVLIGAAGMGVSVVSVTEILQLIGAATGAFIGIWMCAEKLIFLYRKCKDPDESQD